MRVPVKIRNGPFSWLGGQLQHKPEHVGLTCPMTSSCPMQHDGSMRWAYPVHTYIHTYIPLWSALTLFHHHSGINLFWGLHSSVSSSPAKMFCWDLEYLFNLLFCPFLFIFFFNAVSVNWTEWSTIPACPNLIWSFNRVRQMTNSFQRCVFDIYI